MISKVLSYGSTECDLSGSGSDRDSSKAYLQGAWLGAWQARGTRARLGAV